MPPLITIIIPAYNAEAYINNCISSILNQTYSNYEIIIINDGSTDNTAKLLNQYSASKNNITVVHKSNEGVSAARNTALKLATGKWISFIDADDTIHTEYLQHLASLTSSNDSIIIGSAQRIDYSTNRILWKNSFQSKTYNIPFSHSEYSEIDHILECSTLWGKLFKREIILQNNISFNTNISLSEDHLFFFEYMSHIKQIVASNKVIYNYLLYPNTSTLSTNKIHPVAERILAYESIKHAYSKILHNWNLGKCALPKTSSAIARIYGESILNCLQQRSSDLEFYLSKQDSFFNNNYLPKSIKGKLFKLLMTLPICLKKYCLKLLIH